MSKYENEKISHFNFNNKRISQDEIIGTIRNIDEQNSLTNQANLQINNDQIQV